MAVDPRFERLPEHEGPAFRTWQLIMQTTMGSVVQQQATGGQIQLSNVPKPRSKPAPADDFIPLGSSKKENQIEENDEAPKIKKEKQAPKEAVADELFIPWKTHDHYPEDPVGLHLEISDFHKYMKPTIEEEKMRQNVVDRISALIVHIWPSAKVEVFGSFRTKLYLPTSDIDLAVFGKWEKLPLNTLKKELVNHGFADEETIKVLDKASVPIIKLTDKKSKIRVDISFNVESSIKSAELIKKYIEEFRILPSLFLIIKHFLVQRDLNEVFTGGISSYCLMLLTISFLQRHRKVDVRKTKNVNLGVLLMEFLELYGRNFNYQRIAVKIKDDGCYANKEMLAKELGEGTFLPLLCIEDPITHSCEIGKSSYGILRVKDAFEYGFNIIDRAIRNKSYFKVNPNSTYLSRIVSVAREVEEYRQWIRTSYKSFDFVPKTPVYIPSTPVTPQSIYPIAIPNQFISTSNGRPPLLPTPPSPFSPRVNMITSPFSTYPPSTTYGFFGDSNTVQQTIIIPTAGSTGNSDTTDLNQQQIPNLQQQQKLNQQPSQQNPEIVTTPPPPVTQQIHYVVPANNGAYIQQTRPLTQQSFVSPSPSPSSPIKTMPPNLAFGSLITSMAQQRRNNSKANTNYTNKRNTNSARNSQRNSPKTSPKLTNRSFSVPNAVPGIAAVSVPQTTTDYSKQISRITGTESRIHYTADELWSLNPGTTLVSNGNGKRKTEKEYRVPVERFDSSKFINKDSSIHKFVAPVPLKSSPVASHMKRRGSLKDSAIVISSDGE